MALNVPITRPGGFGFEAPTTVRYIGRCMRQLKCCQIRGLVTLNSISPLLLTATINIKGKELSAREFLNVALQHTFLRSKHCTVAEYYVRIVIFASVRNYPNPEA